MDRAPRRVLAAPVRATRTTRPPTGTLAEELLADLGTVDVLVGAVGSGGSLCGTSRALARVACPSLYGSSASTRVGSVLFGQPDRPRRAAERAGQQPAPRATSTTRLHRRGALAQRPRGIRAPPANSPATEKLFAGNTSGSVYRVLGAMAARAVPGTTARRDLPRPRGPLRRHRATATSYWAENDLRRLPVATVPRRGPRRCGGAQLVVPPKPCGRGPPGVRLRGVQHHRDRHARAADRGRRRATNQCS